MGKTVQKIGKPYLGSSSYQSATALSVANVANWNSISTINLFDLNTGDGGITPCKNVGYAQDFMANNTGLRTIKTALHPRYISYYDSTWKISKLKSNWNNYFKQLTVLFICEDHWNHEDLGGLNDLTTFGLQPSNQNHSNDPTNNPFIPIAPSVIDNVLKAFAYGAGKHHTGGYIDMYQSGNDRTSASDAAFNFLISQNWRIYINGSYYGPPQ